MVCSFRCSIWCTKCHCRYLHSRPVRHRRTILLALFRVSPPPIPICITSSITPKRFLLLPLAELLRKTYRFYYYHAGGGSAPNSSGPVQHSRGPATPLKPVNRLGSLPPTPFIHVLSAYPIWYPARLDRLFLRLRDLRTAYLSNHLSGKPRVLHPQLAKELTAARKSLLASLAFSNAGESTQHTSQKGCCISNGSGHASRTPRRYSPWNNTYKPNQDRVWLL